MISKIDPKITLAVMLSKSATEITVVQSILSLLVAFGFLFLDGQNSNYDLLYSFAHPLIWGAIFATHGGIKALSVLTHIPRLIVLINEVLSIWAWCYILLSFTVFDKAPTTPAEMFVLLPIMLEFWTLIDTPISRKQEIGK